MGEKKINNLLIYLLFFVYFIIGFSIYKDYGIGIEEHFQRQNGFYWLQKILSILKIDHLSFLALEKYQEIRSYDLNLPDSDFFNFYGIAFDVPAAFFEIIFELNNSKSYFEIRHLFNFFFFFISSIFFYKILKTRFKDKIIIFFGTIFYIINPRIFGDSFHNNKDIFFLSILTISIYFLFKFFEKQKLKNIILFCLFASIATSSRIMGLYLPILLLMFIFTDYLSKKTSTRTLLKQISLILFFFIFFLYAHYPYMWKLNIFEFFNWFKVFFYNMGLRILFVGDYYHIKYLPRSYLPIWTSITIPVYMLILIVCGYLLLVKRFITRILNINLTTQIFNDLWRSTYEKKDLFVFISLTSFLLFAVLLNVAMLSGWRHFYFLHFFIIYIAVYMLNLTLLYCKRKKFKISIFCIVNLVFILFIIKQLFIFHPYQSFYFNSLINKKNYSIFPVDTASLSRFDALNFIIKDAKKLNKVFVANASWTPLYNGKDLLNTTDKKKLVFVGQDYDKADYIYSNFNYEVDPKFNKKYNIPSQFKEIKKMSIKGIPIYSIYQRVK
ncbi:MAG: glycosyltransferase family 39 protein [Pelagibacteraceae bacterium]|nr:glycosyltransferase family 39 protein [Pelagibacteraceae bacterium]